MSEDPWGHLKIGMDFEFRGPGGGKGKIAAIRHDAVGLVSYVAIDTGREGRKRFIATDLRKAVKIHEGSI